MAIISVQTVRLQAHVADKHDAIRQAGELLVHAGCVAPAYVEGMLAREQTMSTYLGNGVAIPHGQHENRSDVLRTGISVLQVPQGVEWEPGELAYLVIGIAADGDEHVRVLSNLAEIIEDADKTEQLSQTTDPAHVVASLDY